MRERVIRGVRHWVRVSLCANSMFLALYVFLPMAIRGGVVHVEPNVYLRWTEFAFVALCASLGVIEVVLHLRKQERRDR